MASLHSSEFSDPVHDGSLPNADAELRDQPLSPLVLVVDDDQNSREGLTEFLVQAGYRVSEAADGAEALKKAAQRRPDVVLLDLAIPKVDGWTVARRLKTDPTLGNVPVIALSAMDYPDQVHKALVAGCDAFITKPCDLAALVPTIQRVLGEDTF